MYDIKILKSDNFMVRFRGTEHSEIKASWGSLCEDLGVENLLQNVSVTVPVLHFVHLLS